MFGLLMLFLCVILHTVSVSVSVSVLIFRRTLLGYYAEGMHANF